MAGRWREMAARDLVATWPRQERPEIVPYVDPRSLERLLLTLRRNGVTRYQDGKVTLELARESPGAEQGRARPVDPRDAKSVDDFLRARLAPAGGSS